ESAAHRSPCSWTTARSAAAGRARRNGCTTAAGWLSSSTRWARWSRVARSVSRRRRPPWPRCPAADSPTCRRRRTARWRAGRCRPMPRSDWRDSSATWGRSGSPVVSRRRGGVIEEYTRFGNGVNYAAVVTRRFEAYHALAREEAAQAAAPVPDGADGGESGAPSIHDIEKRVRLDRLPPVDRDGRALFVDRVLPADLTLDVYASGEYEPVVSWAAEPVAAEVRATGEAVEVTCRA